MTDSDKYINETATHTHVRGTTTTTQDSFNGAYAPPVLSVVVCHHGGVTNRLIDCIRSVFVSLDIASVPHEVIIATDTRFTYSGVNVLTVTGGLSRARNHAMMFARGDIIAYVDSDVVVYPRWARDIIDTMNDRSIACCGGPVYPQAWYPRVPPQLSWVIGCTSHLTTRPIGANMVFRRAVLLKYPFREDLGKHAGSGMVAEDADVITRMQRDGLRVEYMPNRMQVRHVISTDRMKLPRMVRRAWYEGLSKGHAGICGHNERVTATRLLWPHGGIVWYLKGLAVLAATLCGYITGRMCNLCGRTRY